MKILNVLLPALALLAVGSAVSPRIAHADQCIHNICLGDSVLVKGEAQTPWHVNSLDSWGNVWISELYNPSGYDRQVVWSQLIKIVNGPQPYPYPQPQPVPYPYPQPQPIPYPAQTCIGQICTGDLVQINGYGEVFRVVRILTQGNVQIQGNYGVQVVHNSQLTKVGGGYPQPQPIPYPQPVPYPQPNPHPHPNPNPYPQGGQCIANICVGDMVQVIGATGNTIDQVVAIYSGGSVLVRNPQNGDTATFPYTRLRKL